MISVIWLRYLIIKKQTDLVESVTWLDEAKGDYSYKFYGKINKGLYKGRYIEIHVESFSETTIILSLANTVKIFIYILSKNYNMRI